MNDPARRSGCGTALLVIMGVVLLLPGVCSALTALWVGPILIVGLFGPMPNADWAGLLFMLVVWAVGLLLGYLGIRLIAQARA